MHVYGLVWLTNQSVNLHLVRTAFVFILPNLDPFTIALIFTNLLSKLILFVQCVKYLIPWSVF